MSDISMECIRCDISEILLAFLASDSYHWSDIYATVPHIAPIAVPAIITSGEEMTPN
jgi:hypothetical protein